MYELSQPKALLVTSTQWAMPYSRLSSTSSTGIALAGRFSTALGGG